MDFRKFLESTSEPRGHGFDEAAAAKEFASYRFTPRSELPIRVIALDNTQSTQDANVVGLGGYGHGSLDRARFEWLVNELDDGQDNDQLMVVAAHVPIAIDQPGGVAGWSSVSEVGEQELIAKLHEYPNMILWMAGHRHLNEITPLPSPDPTHPELGFWEVETFSLRDFQEFRTIELRFNADQSLSIIATSVDPAVRTGSLADQSRTFGIASWQLFVTDPADLHAKGPYNAELVVALSDVMKEKLTSACRGPPG